MTAAPTKHRPEDAPKTFVDEFQDRVRRIEEDGHALGLNFTHICLRAGISRATPDRWKRSTPKTIELIAKMESIVQKERAKQDKVAARKVK